MLEIANLSKIYPGEPAVTALKGVTLSIPDGAFVTVVGPSGCGKSTLLRCIAGIETPTAGSITIGEQNICETPVAQRKVEWLPQRVAATFIPSLTIRRNLTLGFRLSGRPLPQEADLERAAEQLGIVHILHKRPRETSGGELQRAALARALLSEPRIFLLDEPLSSLDEARRRETRDLLAEFRRKSKAIFFYVTHDHAEALSLGDVCVVMRDGIVTQAGSPQDVYARPKDIFTAEFLSPSGLNKIHGNWPNAHSAGKPKSEMQWLCFRPDAVAVGNEAPNRPDRINLGAASLSEIAFEGPHYRAKYLLHNPSSASVWLTSASRPSASAPFLVVNAAEAFFFADERS